MKSRLTYPVGYNLLLGLMAGGLIVAPHFFGLLVVIFFVYTVYGVLKRNLVFKTNRVFYLFILFYILYVIGILFTNNMQQSLDYLEYKLSFIVFPLLFSFQLKQDRLRIELVGGMFLVGVVSTMVLGIINSAICYFDDGSFSCFLTVSISPIHHPTYFVVYLLFGILLSWIGWYRKWAYYKLAWIVPFTFLALILHVLSLSLAGILFLMIFFFFAAVYLIYRKWGKKLAVAGLIIVPVIAYLFVTKVPQVEGEYNNAKWYMDQYMRDPESFVKNTPYPMSGSEERLILWTVASGILATHPMGVGTGNVDDIMFEQLNKLGQAELAEKKLNPHNQFLQTGIEIGWLGLLVFLILLGYVIHLAWKFRSGLLLLLATSLAFNSLFESMLQRQSGIVFYTFWICILVVLISAKNGQLNTEK